MKTYLCIIQEHVNRWVELMCLLQFFLTNLQFGKLDNLQLIDDTVGCRETPFPFHPPVNGGLRSLHTLRKITFSTQKRFISNFLLLINVLLCILFRYDMSNLRFIHSFCTDFDILVSC